MQWEEAQGPLETVTAMRAAALPSTHADVIEPFLTLAFVYQNLGKRDLAVQLYEQWLPRKRTLLAGKADAALAAQMVNLAELHGVLGRVADAEALAAEAVPLLRAMLGDNEQTGGALMNHACFLAALGRVGDGLKLAREALDMLERTLGAKNEYVLAAVQNVLKMLHDLNRKEEIEPLVDQWRHKLNNPDFRLLTEEELEKMLPDDLDARTFAPAADAAEAVAQQALGKPFDPAGIIKPAGAYKREWEVLWQQLEAKRLTTDPTMQRIVLDDLQKVGHVSAAESAHILQQREDAAARLIHQKIGSLTDQDFEELHAAYRGTQRDNPDGEPGQVLGKIQI